MAFADTPRRTASPATEGGAAKRRHASAKVDRTDPTAARRILRFDSKVRPPGLVVLYRFNGQFLTHGAPEVTTPTKNAAYPLGPPALA